MQLKQDMPMLREDKNASDNFCSYEDEEWIPEAQDIEKDHKDLVGESSNTRSYARIAHTPQDGLLGSESLSSLKEVRFGKHDFSTGIPVFNIKYDQPELPNNNFFYPFYN